MLTQAQIQKFCLSLTVTPQAYPGTAQPIALQGMLDFKAIANFQFQQGTYTPNNDYLYLAQSIQLAQAPNFMFLICSGQLNLTVSANGGYMIAAVPIFKVWSLVMPPGLPYTIQGVYIEGRMSGISPAPMPQGTPVDYIFGMGQAQLN